MRQTFFCDAIKYIVIVLITIIKWGLAVSWLNCTELCNDNDVLLMIWWGNQLSLYLLPLFEGMCVDCFPIKLSSIYIHMTPSLKLCWNNWVASSLPFFLKTNKTGEREHIIQCIHTSAYSSKRTRTGCIWPEEKFSTVI